MLKITPSGIQFLFKCGTDLDLRDPGDILGEHLSARRFPPLGQGAAR